MYIYGREEHILRIKIFSRSIKDRCRSTYNSMSYRRITKLMVRALIEVIFYILYYFSSKSEISRTMSPTMIVESRPNIVFSKKNISFGAYSIVYTEISNTIKAGATPAIASNMYNNSYGYFL